MTPLLRKHVGFTLRCGNFQIFIKYYDLTINLLQKQKFCVVCQYIGTLIMQLIIIQIKYIVLLQDIWHHVLRKHTCRKSL